MIEIRQGDILASKCEAIVIPVNCVGTAGKGLAMTMKRACPAWFADYKAHCDGRIEVGKARFANRPITPMVFNFPTKQHWRDPSRIEWIRDGLADLAKRIKPDTNPRCPTDGVESIAIPALGCGEGGLQWADVRPLIEAAFADSPALVAIYEPW